MIGTQWTSTNFPVDVVVEDVREVIQIASSKKHKTSHSTTTAYIDFSYIGLDQRLTMSTFTLANFLEVFTQKKSDLVNQLEKIYARSPGGNPLIS